MSTDDNGYKSVDYNKLSSLLIENLKAENGITTQQASRIEALETKVQELEILKSEVVEIKALLKVESVHGKE